MNILKEFYSKYERIREVQIPKFNGCTGIIKGRMFVDTNGKIIKVIIESERKYDEENYYNNFADIYYNWKHIIY